MRASFLNSSETGARFQVSGAGKAGVRARCQVSGAEEQVSGARCGFQVSGSPLWEVAADVARASRPLWRERLAPAVLPHQASLNAT